jgi:hypothetical protein
MPKGPQGQKRPADVIGNAVRVMRIAAGEAEEEYDAADEAKDPRAVHRGHLGGLKGGPAHGPRLTKKERVEMSRKSYESPLG